MTGFFDEELCFLFITLRKKIIIKFLGFIASKF